MGAEFVSWSCADLSRRSDKPRPARQPTAGRGAITQFPSNRIGRCRLAKRNAGQCEPDHTRLGAPRISPSSQRGSHLLVGGKRHGLDFGRHGRSSVLRNSPYVSCTVAGIHSGVRRGRFASTATDPRTCVAIPTRRGHARSICWFAIGTAAGDGFCPFP